MNIGALGATQAYLATLVDTGHKMHEQKPIGSRENLVSGDIVPAGTEPTAEVSAVKQRGVIRNLLAGHFKGVADVRLRINFFEEITAIERAARRESIEGQPETFVSIAQDGLDLIPEDLQSPETFDATMTELLVDYEDSVQTAFAEFGAQPTVSQETLTGSLQAAFSAFVGSLAQTFADSVESEDTEDGAIVARDAGVVSAETAARGPELEESSGIPAPSTDADAPFDLAQFVADLIATFDTALADLELALQSASVLPELSEPRGNGLAYNKHLAAYEAMRADSPSEATTQQQVELDA